MTKDKLLPPELIKQLPKLNTVTESNDNPKALVKYFYPDFNWTWYGIEFDGDDTFFGWVNGFDGEYGYFSLSELMANKGKMGLSIERDLYFKPTPIKDIINEHKQHEK